MGMVDTVCFFFLLDNQTCQNVRTVFTQRKNNIPVLYFRAAGASRRRLRGRGREQTSVERGATRHGMHLSTRETGLTGTQSGQILEDGSEGGMHRERSMHGSLDQVKYCFWAELNHE